MAASPINEVRRVLATSLTPIWQSPCTPDGPRCRHLIALDLVKESARRAKMSAYNERGERHPVPLDLPLTETIAAVDAEDLWVHQLPAPILALAEASRSGCCIAQESEELLQVLLDAYRRDAALWQRERYEINDLDRRAVASVLLSSEPPAPS